MQRSFLGGALILFTAFMATPLVYAGNPEYRCEPGTVDNDAVAITYPDVDVGRYSDPNQKICTFSVGGASSTGSSYYSEAPWRKLIQRVDLGDVQGVVIRLTLARSLFDSDVEEFQYEIEQLLQESVSDLSRCFLALGVAGTSDQLSPLEATGEGENVFLYLDQDSLTVMCSILEPGEHLDLISDVPTLHLSVESDDGRDDSLFVPQEVLYE
ncbi:hypothetical protein ACOJCM_10095 [Billgrantia sp. LNSP4103-1]|uniref:hypothetical protein n=1 Tax=Billgrantia sp. LNSP4103-1 TaxID=3410266 RepID=UPI00403EFF0C